MGDIIQFGAGGHAKVVLEALLASRPGSRPVLLDDDPAMHGRTLLGLTVAGGREQVSQWRVAKAVPAIGNNRAREELSAWLRAQGLELATVIHPAAIVSPSAVIGEGSFFAAGAIVNAEARLGAAVIVNTGASIDHDCRIGDYAHIAPGVRLCGAVSVGERTLIGTGSVVIPGTRIGADVVVGAGSSVIVDVPDGARVAGCPARPI